jgi:hypothetical protein
MRLRAVVVPLVAVLGLIAPREVMAQAGTLDGLLWRIPALRSLRNVATSDSLLAPALVACRTVSTALQADVVTALRERSDTLGASRHAAIPPTQWEAACLLRTLDTLPGLVSRRGSVDRIEEIVGLVRSGRMTGEQRQKFADLLAEAAPVLPTTPKALQQEARQDYLGDFVRARMAEDESFRRNNPLPDLSTPPVPLSLILPPAGYPASMFGTQVVATFLLGPDGVVQAVNMTPEISNAAYRTELLATFMRYRFRPAADKQGRPVGGSFVYTFNFNRGRP